MLFDACIFCFKFPARFRLETILGAVSGSDHTHTSYSALSSLYYLGVLDILSNCVNPLHTDAAKCKPHDGFVRSRTLSLTDSTPFGTKSGILERKKKMGEPDLTATC